MRTRLACCGLPVALLLAGLAWCGDEPRAVKTSADFGQHLRPWDGFGVNYVETHHTRDYRVFPQDYGGFKYLDDAQRRQIIELVFGADGLKPSLVKVFCDPFHEPVNDNNDPYTIDPKGFDHTTTTTWMRYFAREGLKTTRACGGDLVFLAGLYGPPGWMTRQRCLRGRDLDPAMKLELAEYLVAWAKYLRDVEKLPVKYISMHNEGENKGRWRADGVDAPERYDGDYNLWWPDDQVVDFLKYARQVLDRHGLREVGLTSGETTTWRGFHTFKQPDGQVMHYARKIRDDGEALKNLALITSHGFGKRYEPEGIDLLRQARPELHAWTTSSTWGNMSLDLVEDARRLIYDTKCNGLIPWATVHHDYESDKLSPPATFRVSTNAHSPIKTNGGKIEITKAYYHFKQVSRAGQSGMAVAHVRSDDSDVRLIAFAANGTKNPDAVIVINQAKEPKRVSLTIQGSKATQWNGFVTTDVEFGNRNYEPLGEMKVKGGGISCTAPARSVTTFYGRP